MDDTIVKRLRDSLIGAVCLNVEYIGGDGGLPNINFGSRGLLIESAWRVVENGEIIAGTASKAIVRRELTQILQGQTIQEVTVQGHFNDLCLRFESGILLETFAYSDSYEHWNLVGEGPDMIISGPGNLWSEF
jgi:hypothetical protein